MKNILLIFLIAHILGDFYFQWGRLAQKKQKKFRYLLLHSLIYGVVMLGVTAALWSFEVFLYALIAVAAHFVIDIGKWFACKLQKRNIRRRYGFVYIVDQMLHITCIVIISIVYLYHHGDATFISLNLEIDINKVLRGMLLFLVLLKPTNITFKEIFISLKPNDKSDAMVVRKKEDSIGAIIGNMERLLIVILMIVNQYAAIGLVFTAKSIARYNRIANEKEFAEYYLLGTLYSLLVAVVSFLVVWKM